VDLSSEAIRLARMLHALLPDRGDVTGLLALMLLTDARRAARTGASGELVPLDEQDRTLWDREMIDEGTTLVARALSWAPLGSYQLLAAIAALHDEAPSVAATDWPQILALYDLLVAMSDNPVAALNRAVAVAMVHGPAAGLAAVDALNADPRIAAHHRTAAVRAHLHEMCGDFEAAERQYRAAAGETRSVPERDHLLLRATRVAARRSSPAR
jgi:predicted RNA polymerase sigma factor